MRKEDDHGVICILCQKQDLTSLVKEMEDWKDEGIKVFQFGNTGKLDQGYVLLEYGQPISANFQGKLRRDDSFIDFIAFGSTSDLSDTT